jgi:hypothetical protein
MAFIASKSYPDGSELENSANMMQATFLARLLLAKLFEFKQIVAVESSPLPNFISAYFEPTDVPTGIARVGAILDYFSNEKWIRVARNKHFLHYPYLDDVLPTLNDPDIEWQVEVAHGVKSGNTFYPTSDAFANYAWFRLANPTAPMTGFGEALDTIRELARLTLDTLERAIGHFVDQRLMQLSSHEVIRIQARQSIYQAKLHYFLKL